MHPALARRTPGSRRRVHELGGRARGVRRRSSHARRERRVSATLETPTPRAGEDERWRQWSAAYAESGRKSTKQVRIVFGLVVIALAIIVVMT